MFRECIYIYIYIYIYVLKWRRERNERFHTGYLKWKCPWLVLDFKLFSPSLSTRSSMFLPCQIPSIFALLFHFPISFLLPPPNLSPFAHFPFTRRHFSPVSCEDRLRFMHESANPRTLMGKKASMLIFLFESKHTRFRYLYSIIGY